MWKTERLTLREVVSNYKSTSTIQIARVPSLSVKSHVVLLHVMSIEHVESELHQNVLLKVSQLTTVTPSLYLSTNPYEVVLFFI